jgi:plasmid stabilization system protein ParE
MAIKIAWADEATKTFDENLNYLLKEWSEREAENFVKQANAVFGRLKKYPESYPPSPKSNKVRKERANKYITLYYRFYPSRKEIMLLTWWNVKQDSKKLKF